MTLLEISQLKKSFTAPDGAAHGVVNIKEFHLAEREHAALQGESGCGKTTFLHLIAGILKPDSGAIKIAGREMSALREPARSFIARLRQGGRGVSCVGNITWLLPAWRGNHGFWSSPVPRHDAARLG